MLRPLSTAALLLLAGAVALGAANGAAASRALAAADDAWERGDYITALTGYIKLLEPATVDDAVLEPIALKTGELFETRELTADGRSPKFSRDGNYVAYNRLDNTIRYSNPGIRDVQHGAAMLFTRLITYDALYFKGTDAAAYYDAYGDIVGGIGSYPVLSSPHYHQAHDLLEFENHELITETSRTTAATLMLLASSPSRIRDLKVEHAGGSATVTWAPSPEKGITSYIVEYGPEMTARRSSVGNAASGGGRRVTVKTPRAQLAGVAPGTVIAVKAVNAKGLEGWDWARVTVR